MADTPQGPQYGPERQTERVPILDEQNIFAQGVAKEPKSTFLNDVTNNALFSKNPSGAAQSSDLEISLNRNLNPGLRNMIAQTAAKKSYEQKRKGLDYLPFYHFRQSDFDPKDYEKLAEWYKDEDNLTYAMHEDDIDEYAEIAVDFYQWVDSSYLKEINRLLHEEPSRQQEIRQNLRARRNQMMAPTREDVVRSAFYLSNTDKDRAENIYQKYRRFVPASASHDIKLAAPYIVDYLSKFETWGYKEDAALLRRVFFDSFK